MWYRWHADRRKRKHKRRLWGCEVTCLLVYLTVKVCLPPNVFIVFSYRRLSDVMCADRHWKLVYRWISAHITLLAEHPPISGSFLFFSITITRIRKNYPLLSRLFQWNFRVLSAGGKLSRVFFEIFRLTTLKSLSARPEISKFAVSERKIRQFS